MFSKLGCAQCMFWFTSQFNKTHASGVHLNCMFNRCLLLAGFSIEVRSDLHRPLLQCTNSFKKSNESPYFRRWGGLCTSWVYSRKWMWMSPVVRGNFPGQAAKFRVTRGLGSRPFLVAYWSAQHFHFRRRQLGVTRKAGGWASIVSWQVPSGPGILISGTETWRPVLAHHSHRGLLGGTAEGSDSDSNPELSSRPSPGLIASVSSSGKERRARSPSSDVWRRQLTPGLWGRAGTRAWSWTISVGRLLCAQYWGIGWWGEKKKKKKGSLCPCGFSSLGGDGPTEKTPMNGEKWKEVVLHIFRSKRGKAQFRILFPEKDAPFCL